jgi:predicted HAD superfamily Cof-like phosphohydrolase
LRKVTIGDFMTPETTSIELNHHRYAEPPPTFGGKIAIGSYPLLGFGEPERYNSGPYSSIRGIPNIRYVYEFYHIYDHPISEVPALPSFERRILRAKVILEEYEELLLSSDTHSKEVIEIIRQLELAIDRIPSNQGESFNPRFTADALGDLEYFIDGYALEAGIPMERVQYEIHKSNLSKLGENGKPIKRADGKVLKGPNYKEPDLSFLPERIV